MTSEDQYRCQEHGRRIEDLEYTVKELHDGQERIEFEVKEINRRLENGISKKLEKLTIDMAELMPYIKSKMMMDKIIFIAAVGIILSGIATLFVFILKLYFHG